MFSLIIIYYLLVNPQYLTPIKPEIVNTVVIAAIADMFLIVSADDQLNSIIWLFIASAPKKFTYDCGTTYTINLNAATASSPLRMFMGIVAPPNNNPKIIYSQDIDKNPVDVLNAASNTNTSDVDTNILKIHDNINDVQDIEDHSNGSLGRSFVSPRGTNDKSNEPIKLFTIYSEPKNVVSITNIFMNKGINEILIRFHLEYLVIIILSNKLEFFILLNDIPQPATIASDNPDIPTAPNIARTSFLGIFEYAEGRTNIIDAVKNTPNINPGDNNDLHIHFFKIKFII